MRNLVTIFFILISKMLFPQAAKLMLPIGHADLIASAQFSPDGKKIVTASYDNTAKIWDAVSGKLIANLIGHTEGVLSASFSPDGKKVVTASGDNTAKIWDAATGNLIANLIGHTDWVLSASFSPAGKKVVTASNDNTAKIWDAVTGNLIANLKGHTQWVLSAYFSTDGKKVITASWDKTAKIWDAVSGKVTANLIGHTDWVLSASFSPDGKKIVTTSADHTAKIWDAKNGKLLFNLTGHSESVNSANFSPDGKKIITASNENTAKIWDAATGNLIANLKRHTLSVNSAIFSPDGKKVVIAYDDNTAKIWDAVSGKLIADLKGHTSFVISASFSPDGKKIVTASWDHTAKIWDASTGNIFADLKGRTSSAISATFSPDGKRIVTTSDDNITRIWDVESGVLIADIKGYNNIISASFSSDGKKILTMSLDSAAKTWDAESGKLLLNLTGHSERVKSAHYSPDGKKIVTASDDNTAKIWDAVSGKLLYELFGHAKDVFSATFSPDGKKIVTASFDRTAKIWDVATGNLVANLKGHSSWVTSAIFSPDGKKIVSASVVNGTVKIWDAESGKFLFDLTTGHTDGVTSAAFSPDGKKIVTASADNTAKIWNIATGNLIADLKGHSSMVYSATFSPDGKMIVTASADNIAKIWNVATGNLAADLRGHSSRVNSATFSPDGKMIVTTSSDNTTKLWDSQGGKLIYTFFSIDSTDYLVVDSKGRYDGTEIARKLLYFICGTNVIGLDQVKDQLWVPNLAERIMKGDSINAKKLEDLNLCGLTPEVEDVSTKPDEYYFKITPRRGGLGETVVYINGIEARRLEPEQLKRNENFYELLLNKAELSIYFSDGNENQVTIKAYTSDNTISSRGLIITAVKSKTQNTPPNLYAVMVGVSKYKGDQLDLKYAAKDATDISNALGSAAKKLLNTDGKEHVFMYNLTTGANHYQLPEKNSIKKVLEEIGTKAIANDILLIFFAGHGVMSARSGTDGDGQNKQFYFLTSDASGFSNAADVGISTAELTDWMKPQNIKAQKRILILDACNSGQAIKDFVKLGSENQNYLAARNDDRSQQIKAIDKLNEKSGLFILSASASNQSAYEMGRYSQGLLTYSLLKAIKQQPDILEDGKYLNVSRWFNAAEKTVSELSKESGARQEPQIVSNTNFNIGLVDDEVIAKIILPTEKPLFSSSIFLNADENISDDDLELSKLINLQLNDISNRGSDSKLVYMMTTNSPDAYSLSGRYTLKGNTITIAVNIKQNKLIKNKFELTGTKDKLKELAVLVAEKAVELAK